MNGFVQKQRVLDQQSATVFICHQLERVVSNINVLKGEVCKRPFWLCTMAFMLCHFVVSLRRGIAALFQISKCLSKTMTASKAAPAALDNNFRIFFVDDLDRCQEAVILQFFGRTVGFVQTIRRGVGGYRRCAS